MIFKIEPPSKMNPEIKQKWVDALRSGQYKQGRFNLRLTKNSFCCLGVLCELHRKEHKKRWGVNKNKEYTYYANNGTLPEEVLAWVGLEPYDDVVHIRKINKPLTRLNDEGSTFEEIADVIEKYL